MDSLFSPYKCPSSELGEYVMMESCLDHGDITESAFVRPKREKNIEKRLKRAFPPPLTMLAMTENQTPHMPFVMRRYYTDDGRLVIIEERVKHHDYFKVTRTDGRLVLDLVPALDGNEDTNFEEIDVVTEKENVPLMEKEMDFMTEKEMDFMTEKEMDFMTEKEMDFVAEKERDFSMENMRDYVMENEFENMGEIESLAVRSVVEKAVVMGGAKCYDYMRVRSSPCLFEMTVPTVRPVHI